MRKRGVDRFHFALGMLGYLVPAWLLLSVAAILAHPASPVLVLIADAVALTGICRALGFDIRRQTLLRCGLAYFVLLVLYTALIALLLAAPGLWLLRGGGLPAALTLSAAVFLAIFAPWRIWPAFVLPFLWDDAYPRSDERTSWLATALTRSLAFARHLTGQSELFFAYGLPAGLSLFLLSGGCLALDGLAGALTPELRTVGYIAYGLVVVPFAHLILVNRTLRALMARVRADRHSAAAASGAGEESSPAASSSLPPDSPAVDLDATLLCAAHSSQVELALAAIERGANPDAMPPPEMRDQRSVLMIAATLPDARLLRALIAAGADVNRVHGGITPLISVTRDSYQGRPESVMTLLANGADPRRTDAEGNAPLHYAARCAEAGVAALLLDASADVNAVNAEGMSALGVACNAANWTLAAFLIERGAKAQVPQAQPAVLAAAGIAEDDPTGVRMLLKQRAEPDARGPFDRTALMAAALAGHAHIVDALLQAGADPNLADQRGTTALIEAARAGSANSIHALGKRKANVDAVDASGRSALTVACQSRHASEEAVRALLSLGANKTLVGNDGKRALDHAAAAGRWHVVALLDPEYPLPSNLGRGAPQAHEASIDHLLDALRFDHWKMVDEFTGVIGQWAPSALADLYADLAEPGRHAARDWLLNHGLGGDTCLQDGRWLGDVLLASLPASSEALAQWLARGLPVGGAGLVARVLEHALDEEDGVLRALARELLARGGDWNGRGKGLRSALHLATAIGDSDLIEALLQRGADPNARDAQGRTALHLVLRLDADRALPLLRRLIHAGADPEIATSNGETALGLALARRDDRFARWLDWAPWHLPGRPLRGADLPAAAAAGDIDAVDRLLDLGLPIDSEDGKGATALIHAAGSGHAALAVHLLDAGADASRVAHTGVNCLAAAIAARRESLVRTLLNHGVAPDLRLAGGATALMIAASLGNLPMLEALLEAGADPNIADETGATALHAAAQQAFDSSDTATAHALLDRLLRAGANPALRNLAGQDALLVLLGARSAPGTRCDGEHLARLTELLLGYGAKPETQDQRGVGVLHACALHGLFGCARMLKAHGAPLDLTDAFGRRAADVASLIGYADVAGELDASRQSAPSVRQTLRRPAADAD